MIKFVTGKPGDGKSMYGMQLIVETLMTTDRIVVTNIPVKLKELRGYLILKGWKPTPGNDIQERVRLLAHEEVFEFYRYRSGGYELPPSPDWERARNGGEDADGNKVRKLSRYEFIRHMTGQMREMKKNKRALRPVEYHIDEAHDYFSAREWADTGRGILWYASKHRHLHDEIVLYTQVMKNVESQLRTLAGFTVRARNQLRMSWGPFRKAPIFRLYHYYGGPEDCDKVTPFNTGVMHLDRKGLCSTYNSTGALSVHSKPEEIKNKAPLPYWALPVAAGLLVVCVCAFVALTPMYAGKVASRMISSNTGEVAKAMGVDLPGTPAAPASPSQVQAQAQPRAGTDQGKVTRAEFLKPHRAQADAADELPEMETQRVQGVMETRGGVFVKVAGEDWSRVHLNLGQGLLELANGVVVKRRDVLNPGKRAEKKEPTEKTGAQ